MATRPSKVVVHGQSDNKNVWYCIDLESLPEQDGPLSVVAELGFEKGGGWTLVGDNIYWVGGAAVVNGRMHPTGLLWRNRSADVDDWEVVSSSKKFKVYNPRVVAFHGNRICVLGGQMAYMPNQDQEDTERSRSEVYVVEDQTWYPVALNIQELPGRGFTSHNTALLLHPNGEPKDVVCFSIVTGQLLFYCLCADSFTVELHPRFSLHYGLSPQEIIEKGLGDCDSKSVDLLIEAARSRIPPVLRDFTLYWFTPDFFLYGYDIVKKRWFRSEQLNEDQLWKLSADSLLGPCLTDMYNGQFILLMRTESQRLGMAILGVSKSEELLEVSVESRHTFCPWSAFVPLDGMAIYSSEEASSLKAECSCCCSSDVL